MDSSLPWLSFSLSNHPSHISIFHSFDSQQCVMERVENGGCTDLSMLGPKLEDFLGGRYAMKSPATETSDPPTYDSDLNTITTTGFFPSDAEKALAVPTDSKKSVDTFGQRTSIYRGVTRHRWTGRYEAHLWDNSCRREGQSRKGRQVYLGGYDKEDKAARAYDLAALKYWGPNTTTNFPVTDYEKELEEMKNMTRQEFVASLRRKSSGFSRGASIYRGVTRHHQHGRWQARIGRVAGNKDLYLGTFSTQEEAAEAYDIAAIKFRGLNAVTNFDMSRYDVQGIMSSNLPIGGVTNKSKTWESSSSSSENKMFQTKHLMNGDDDPFGAPTSSLNFALGSFKSDGHDYSWSSLQSYQIMNPSQNGTCSDHSTTTATSAASFRSDNAPSLALDYSAASSLGHGYGAFSSGGIISVQESQHFSAATPTTLPSTHDGPGYNGNWAIPSDHGCQYVRSNLLQTPIYGME